MPIHEKVLAIGFMRFVEAMRALGQTELFPDLASNQFGKKTKEASRRANRLIDDVVTKDKRLVFHSLRHKFKDEGRSVGISDTMLDQMTGHSPLTVGARYGDGAPTRILAKRLNRIKFDMIDWAPIATAFAPVDWDAIAARLVAHVKVSRNAGQHHSDSDGQRR